MKKRISLLLALTLLLSMGAAAFAETISYSNQTSGQTHEQTITVKSPALTWILEVPASLEIEFGNTEQIEMGNVKISNVSWDTLPVPTHIIATVDFDEKLTGITSSDSYIPYGLSHSVRQRDPDMSEEANFDPELVLSGMELAWYYSNINYLYSTLYLNISADRWQLAAPGEQYKGTITYSSQYLTQ